jgi:hypothetical protein
MPTHSCAAAGTHASAVSITAISPVRPIRMGCRAE